MLEPSDASDTQQQDEAASGSDELDLDGDHRPSKDRPKVKGFSITSKSYCYLCGKGVIKFFRHLLRHIHEDPEIAEILALPKTSKDRRRLVDELRNRGNYRHNQEVLKNSSGELKLRRRLKNMAISVETHLHCLYCKGMYAHKKMTRHLAECPSRTMSNPSTGGKTRVFGNSPYIQKLPRGVRKMLLAMKQDEVAYAVQNDFLLIQLAQKYGNNPKKHEEIRQKLREMGRLLLELNEKSISNFKDAIKPQNFQKVVEAVKKLSGFNEEMQSYDKPGLASRLGHSLTKMCTIVFTGVDSDDRMLADTKTFMELCEKEWFSLVSHTALASPSGRKVSNPSTIPFTRDVQVFYKYLEKTFASAIENLQKYESPQAYKALCRVTLAQASVLSKCIPEVSKMTVKTFQERDNSTQVLSKHFIKINIQSRTGQNVAVLLTSDLVNAITLLVDKRQACGVHKKNPFLFAMPNSSPTSLFHGANCIRAFLRLCRAKNPERFRSVHLHKHTARVFQILNLENDELAHLAKLLGRDIRVDRDYFRLPEAAGELAKISKLLLAMEKGSLEKYKGDSLEEIEIEDELEPDVVQGNPENCDAEEDAEESDVSPQQSEAAEQDRQLTPEQDALDHIKACRDKPFLEERFIDPFKGRGVFTRESIQPSTFVVEYRGIIFSPKETRKKCGDTLNHYMFDFSWIGTNWRIDAANEDGTLGRLVNDDHTSPNCEMKKIVSEGIPHLCLFAVTEISPGEEITYNYGDLSYPWRPTESSEDISQAHVQFSPDEESGDDEHYIPDTSANDHQSFEEPSTFGASCIQQEDESDYSPDDDFTSDEEAKFPTPTNKNYCYVCGIAQSKISRHLFTHRKEEPDIAAVLKLRSKSKERKALLKKLRDRGNIKHNDEVLKTCCGELKVKRILHKKRSAAKTFAPCLYCKSLIVRENMWRHMQTCSGKKLSDPLLGCKSKVSTLVAVAESDTQNPSPDVWQLLDTLKNDEITSGIWSDSLLLAMAQCSYIGNGRKAENIKLRLRQLGRLLLSLKERSISSFEDAVKPQNSSKLVEAVRELACFNEDTNSYERPSLIKKLRNSLKRIADINFARAWKEGAGSERIQEAEAFMKLCAKEWGYVRQSKPKVDNQPTVPFVHDVQNFLHCMEKSAASALLSLTLYESSPVYNALLRVTVAQLMVLNKNMGEASKATLKSFKERDEAELHEDADASRSPLEQILSKHTVKINVTTDEGQQVAVELTPALLTAITLLVDKREACGVHENNPFLFGLPDASCTSIHHRQRCVSFFLGRCGAKNAAVIRLPSFHKHIKRVFQILNLTDDELVELSKALGRDIQTDRGYYQTPEASADISELLSAIEKESLERLKRKSLEEIKIPEEELEEDVEPDDPEDSEAEEETESSFLNSPDFAKSSFSRRRRRVRRTRQVSENEGSELHEETNEEVNSEKDVGSKEMAESCALNTPEETASPSNEDAASVPFSDGDEDMNVDFDMDTEEDNDDEERDTDGSTATPLVPDVRKQDSDSSDTEKDNISAHKHPGVSDPGETVDTDTGNHVERGGGAEKKNILSAAMIGMKGVKILIPKLDIEKFRAPVHISQLSSELNSAVKDQPNQDIKNQRRTSSPITNIRDDSSSAMMSCSHCKKSMMKGQTAYQKKGFTEVFCSKNCLFELFPSNAPVYKMCHVCLKAITQPLDLIMAAVDVKGTMKDFCSTTCLISFKSNTVSPQTPQQLCSMCNKSCTMTCQLILNRAVHAFCSDSCLEDFRRDNVVNCENCSSACHKETLQLKLEEGTKTICSQNCLEEFRETMEALHHCTMCRTSLPVSDMVASKTEENLVELFCNRACVTSYMLRPANAWEHQAKEFLDQTNKLQRIHVLSAEDDGTDSTPNKIDPPAESDSMPTLSVAKSPVTCSSCRKWLLGGKTLFQAKKNSLVFCSSECLNKNLPGIRSVTKKCYNCLQMIMQPHKLILAPVDDSGTMKELCSNTCLASVNSKRSMAAHRPPARAAGPRAECKMCAKYCHYKHKWTQDHIRLCSDACLINYHKITNVPLFTCEVCSSFFLQKWLQLSPEDGNKTICSDECLVKFKEKVKTPRLCPMCQTPHQLSDMVEHKTDDRLDFFCSGRCMTLHKASTVSGRNSPSSEDGNAKEVKWSLQENDVKEVKASPEEEDIKEVKVSPEEEDIKEVKVSPEEDIKEVKVSPEEDIKEVKVSPEEEDIKEVKVSPEEDIKEVKVSPEEEDIKEVKVSPEEEDIKEVKVSPEEEDIKEVKVSPEEDIKEVKVSPEEDIKEVKVSPEEEDIKEVKVSPEEEDIKEVKVSPEEEDIKEVKVSPEEDIKEVKVSPEEEDIKEVKVSPEEDINEVKPPLPNLDYIKEEPIDEEYNQNVPASIYTEDIKDEPTAGDDVVKEGLKIGSVFSLTGGSASKTPPVPHMDMSASCSNCKRVLMEGETVSRRKGHADIFCSTPCLLKFYQIKQVKKTCHFCLQGITQPQDLVQAPVDNEQTMKDFCSKTCLSSFRFKRFTSTKIPLTPIASQSQCSVCSRYCISKHEVIQQDVVHKICSDPCFLRFCNLNQLSVCENCRCSCNTPLVLQMDDGSKTLCSAECLAQFKRKTQRLQPCAMCRSARVMSDMFENKNAEDAVELFCTSSCVMASKIQAVSASGTPLDCDHCGKNTLPACHLAMSDFSITNFCTLSCAMTFKETQKDTNAASKSTGAAEQTQCDFLKPPEKLPCAQCRQMIETTPKVIQEKGKVDFVCSLACSQEFKTVNNIFGQCEYCKNERIIGDVEKVDGKDCYFCNDGCKMLFRHELVKLWGKHCGLCAYCFSISKTLVTAKYGGADKEFCSEGCSSKYNKLLCQVAKCDTCGRGGKLKQSLPMLGEVKHFCDLRCLRRFCNKNVQLVNSVSSAPGSSGTVDSSPVIANVISLASVLARHTASASSTQHVSVPDIQPKVVGHASVQTVPRELKNKSILCTPLVHNKGVSCTTQTVDAEAQTDNLVPKVIVLPVPVPMYVPLPMNMYSQYTPTPVALPLPIPVPVFLPDSTVRSVKERIQPDLLEGDESERKNVQDERREDRVVTEEGQRVHSPKGKTFDEYEDRTSTRIVDLDSDHQTNNQEDSTSDTRVGSLRHKKTLPVLETGLSCEPTRELPPPAAPLKMSSPDPEPAPQTVGKVHNKNKGRKQQRSSNAAEEETSKRQKITSRTHRKLKSQCGTDAWKRWIQWRNSQTNLDLLSPHAVKLKEDVLCCSATELSDGLCRFITEAKQPNGEPHSPDSLFYLCLSIQQYLFDNGRMENIFTDLIYSKFSTKFINILRTFKPSISASGYIRSRVEEGFLWDCKQLGAYSPIVLLNTLLFFCCKYFGFTTVEQHCQLSFAHVMCYIKTNQNNTKTNFLCFYPPKPISEAESGTDGSPAKKRWKYASKRRVLKMMENTENPLRCPVRLFQFYLSKCSESVRQRTDSFYLHPDGRCVPSSPLWFSSSPLDRGCMEAMLVRSLAVRQQRGKDERGAPEQQTSADLLA